jgi:hypothetical protein
MWLLRRCGPLLTGVYLKTAPGDDSYEPIIHLHSLARPDRGLRLSLSQELLTARTHAPDAIKVKLHEKRWQEAASRLAEQALLPLAGPVTLEQLHRAFRTYRDSWDGDLDPNLYEDWLLSLAWAGRRDDVLAIIAEAQRDMSTWPDYVLAEDRGMDAWLRRMREKTSDPDKLRLIVEKELVKHKAEHLPAVDVSSWFVGPPPPLPKPPRRKPAPSVAKQLRQVSQHCLRGAPVPPTLRALWEAGAEGEWLLQGAELELLSTPKEALHSLQEDPEESPAQAQAQARLSEEMALVAWSNEGYALALWRFAPEQSWEEAATVALDEKVGFYCTAASLADHVVLALGEREEEALAWFRERGSHVSASVAQAQARLRRLPSPEYRLSRYLEEEAARERDKVLPALPPTRTAEPQQLADLLGMSAADPRVEALLQELSVADKPLGLECDGWGRVAMLSFTQENLRAPLAVEGVHLGDSREQVHATLGAPCASGQEWERYERQERGLRLDYRRGHVRAMSLLWLPAVPEPWR